MVRGDLRSAEVGAQLNAYFATRIRGSRGPLPPIGDRDELKTDDPVSGVRPKALFFMHGRLCEGENVGLCQHFQPVPKLIEKYIS
jgi:hypothetical protein